VQSFDSEVLNALERILSADSNDAQSYLGRALGGGLRGGIDDMPFGESLASMPAVIPRSSVLGLNLRLNGGVIETSSGLVFARQNGQANDPIDSSLRMGRVDVGGGFVSTGLAVPASGGAVVYYLIEAQVVQAVTNQNRDIKNPVDQTFSPVSIPKIRLNGVQFFITAGSATTLPASDPDRVPIAALRVPVAPATPTSADLIDLRPFAGDRAGGVGQVGVDQATISVGRSSLTTSGSDTFAQFAFDAEVNGLRCRAVTSAPIDIDPLVATGELLADGVWYVYLHGAGTQGYDRPTRAANPYNSLYLNNLRASCGIVLSQSAPQPNGQPTGLVEPAAPFAGASTRQMGHVGTLYRDGGNWRQQRDGIHEYAFTPVLSAEIANFVPAQASYKASSDILEMWLAFQVDKVDPAPGTIDIPLPVSVTGPAGFANRSIVTVAGSLSTFTAIEYNAGQLQVGLQGPNATNVPVRVHLLIPRSA